MSNFIPFLRLCIILGNNSVNGDVKQKNKLCAYFDTNFNMYVNRIRTPDSLVPD